VLVLSLIPAGGLLWRGTMDIQARKEHDHGLTRTAAPTGGPSPLASRPSGPESTMGSSAERTRAIENMKLRAKAATPEDLNSNVVQKLSESVYCYITMIRSLYEGRNFVTAEYRFEGNLEGLLRARRPEVLYSTEAFILCDDQDAGATYLRSYRNLYVVLAASGKDPDLLRAEAGVANLDGFEWTGDFRGGLSTLRSLRTGRYVTMDAGAPGDLRGMLRARAANVGEWERFQITLYSPNKKYWIPPNPLASEAKIVAETDFGDLSHTPGARRRQDQPTTIDLAPGLRIRLILQTTDTVDFHDIRQHCPASSLCVFEHPSLNFARMASYELIFTGCDREWDLGAIPYPGGGRWLDRVTSIVNNQSDSAYFYDIDTHDFYQPVLSMAPQSVHHDLARGRSQVDDRDLNDRIDGVHVCGPAPTPWVPDRDTPVAVRPAG
jgi:hypothetical protein